MNIFEKDDTLLARWLSGNITPEERAIVETHPDFPSIKKVVDMTEYLAPPDADMAGLGKKLLALIEPAPGTSPLRVSYRRWWWLSGMTAAVALLVIFLIRPKGETPVYVETHAGEQKTVYLPDSSMVRLNAKSSVQFDPENWSKNRHILLKGEAFFDVRRKEQSPFSIETNKGDIEVLGTTFTVRETAAVFEVSCFTGKVRASNQKAETTLIAGERARVNDASDKWIKSEADPAGLPSWMNGESRFEEVPYREVLDELERQFGISIPEVKNAPERFSGAFPHNNLNVALESVCKPYGLNFRKEGQEIVIY